MKKTLLLIFSLFIFSVVQAQRITHNFHNVTMSDALQLLNKMNNRYTINFIYNDLEDFRVTANVKNQSVPEAIRQLIGFYPISFSYPTDSIISVECSLNTKLRYKGRIVDENGHPAEFTNITLLSPVDSAIIGNGVSNASGYFVIPCESKMVITRISSVGYKTIIRPYNHPNMGTIKLQSEPINIKGVVVKGSRPQYKMTEGGITVDVEHSLLSKVGTASDVLSELPRISVKNGEIQVFAKGTPDIYINNKLVRSSTELSNLKSEDIKSVDVITSPGAQYNSQTNAVIRIKTLRGKGEGFSLTAKAKVGYDSRIYDNEMLQTKFRKGKFEISNTLQFENRTHQEDNELLEIIDGSHGEIAISQQMKDQTRARSLENQVSLSYDINENNSIGASYEISKQLSFHTNASGTQAITCNGISNDRISQEQHQEGDYLTQEMNAYYLGKVEKLNIDFNGSYLWLKHNSRVVGSEISERAEDRSIHSYSNSRSHMLAGKLELTYPLLGGNITIGSEYTHTNSAGDYTLTEGYVDASNTLLKESNIAGFAQYEATFGHWNINAGIRYEHVNTDYYSKGEWEKGPSKRYSDWFPNVGVSWHKNQMGWQLNYTLKTNRPTYHMLQNYMQYDNRYTYEGGNPYLRPENNHTIETAFMWRWFNITAGYQYSKNNMQWTTSLYKHQDIAFIRNVNYDKIQSTYVSVVASPKFGWYQPQYEIDYRQMFFDAISVGGTRNLQSPSFQVYINNRFKIGKTWMAYVNLEAYTDGQQGFLASKGYVDVSLRLRKSLMNDTWEIDLGANNLCNNRERWTMYGIGVVNSKDCNNFDRCVRLIVTYNFNATRSRYKGTGAGNDEKRRL